MTGRKSNFAVVESESRMAWLVVPGIETMIVALSPLPCVVTSDSATPKPSTRWRIISTDCLSWSSVTGTPLVETGDKITCVPPRRSSPSRGECDSPGQNAQASKLARMRPRMVRVRPGLNAVFVGAATVLSPGRSVQASTCRFQSCPPRRDSLTAASAAVTHMERIPRGSKFRLRHSRPPSEVWPTDGREE